jgi:hypothetical protein
MMRITVYPANGSTPIRLDLNEGSTAGTAKVKLGSAFNSGSHKLVLRGNTIDDAYRLSEGDVLDIIPTKTAGAVRS